MFFLFFASLALTLIVNLLSEDDGCLALAEAVRSFAMSRTLAKETITMDDLDKWLSRGMGYLPTEITNSMICYEPELLIKLGRHPSTEGYPPLLLRWTEMIFTDASHLSLKIFMNALECYAHCEQRKGA